MVRQGEILFKKLENIKTVNQIEKDEEILKYINLHVYEADPPTDLNTTMKTVKFEEWIFSFSKSHKVDSGIVAEGEFSGHTHKVQNGNVFYFFVLIYKPHDQDEWNQNFSHLSFPAIYKCPYYIFIVEAFEDTTIVHEEHAPIKLDPGIYLVIRQREYGFDIHPIRPIQD